MEETIGCKTVQQLETFLQEEYHAQPVEPVDYLLYNARQQMLNPFLSAADAATCRTDWFWTGVGRGDLRSVRLSDRNLRPGNSRLQVCAVLLHTDPPRGRTSRFFM